MSKGPKVVVPAYDLKFSVTILEITKRGRVRSASLNTSGGRPTSIGGRSVNKK